MGTEWGEHDFTGDIIIKRRASAGGHWRNNDSMYVSVCLVSAEQDWEETLQLRWRSLVAHDTIQPIGLHCSF